MVRASRNTNKDENVTIRLASKKDYLQIIAVQLKSLEVLAAKDYQPHQLQALLNNKSYPRSVLEIVFVAEVEDKIIGFAALDRYTSSLAGLFVDPDYTRQGIGTKLLQKVEIEAVRLNIPILWVCASLTGYPFYQANNYQTIKKNSILIDYTFIPCIQMKKRLLTPTKKEKTISILYFIAQILLIVWSLIIVMASL